MQIKNVKTILILNGLVILTIFFNKNFWGNLLILTKGVDLSLLSNTLAELLIPLLIYIASVFIIIFCVDKKVRGSKRWLNVNLYLNLLPIVVVIAVALFVLVFLSNSAMLAMAALTMCIVPVINFLSLKDYAKKIREVKERIGVDGFSELMASAVFDDFEKISNLIAGGSNVNDADSKGYTPLMYAASNGCYESCKILIDSGADKALTTKKGSTALHFAEKNNHSKIIFLLKN